MNTDSNREKDKKTHTNIYDGLNISKRGADIMVISISATLLITIIAAVIFR